MENVPAGPSTEVYRFSWLRSFDHPIAVRLTLDEQNGTGMLTAKETSGHAGYEPGTLIRNKTRRQSKVEVQVFRDALAETDFWKLPSREQPKEGMVGLDGA